MGRRFAALPKLIGLSAAAWFAAWACAPPTALAPPVPMAADQHREVGGTASGSALMHYRWDHGQRSLMVDGGAGVNLWAMWNVKQFDLGGTLGAEFVSPDLVGHAGFFARYRAMERENLVIAPQLGFGWSYASLALPVAVQARDDLWLYTAPELGFRLAGPVQVPVGVSVGLREDLLLNAEVGVIPGLSGLGYLDGTTVYGGVGLSARR